MQRNYWVSQWVEVDGSREPLGADIIRNNSPSGWVWDIVAGFEDFVKNNGKISDYLILMTYTDTATEQLLINAGLVELSRAVDQVKNQKGKLPQKWQYLVDQVVLTYPELQDIL